MCISASVGRDCDNGKSDVKTVQILLNMNLDKLASVNYIQTSLK